MLILNIYDEKKEKHLPGMILKVYETAQTKLLTIPVQIENINTPNVVWNFFNAIGIMSSDL